MTFGETTASKRWCPFAMVVSERDIPHPIDGFLARMPFAANRIYSRHYASAALDGTMCIASNCMAWRRTGEITREDGPLGYCGAFGPPAAQRQAAK